MSTKEGNKLIAEFMGRDKAYDPRDKIYHYDTEWNWLMPVVEKIEKNHFFDIPTRLFDNYSCVIMKLDRAEFPKHEGWEAGDNEIHTSSTSKIESVYKAVVEFIKWYNEQKK